MSKITTEKKEAKLKGKQAKIAKSKANKSESEAVKKPVEKCKNYCCCCTCVHYPKHASNGEAQKCKVLKNYVGRKVQHPECYKCKY